MRKPVSLLLAIWLLLSMLTGCGVTELPDQAGADVTVDAEVPKEVTGPECPEEPDLSKEPEPLPALLENREALDGAGVLWYIPNETLETERYQDLYAVGDNLLLTRLVYNGDPYGGGAACTLHLAMLSVETGTVLQEVSLDGFVSTHVQICADRIAVSDWETGRLILLDSALNICAEYTLDENWHSAYLSYDAETIYGLTAEEGICAEVLATGEQTWQLEQLRDVYASALRDDTVSFSCVNLATQFTEYGVLNLTDGSVELLPYDGAFYGVSYCDGTWLSGVLGEDELILVGETETPAYLDIGNGSVQLSAAGEETRLLAFRVGAGGDLSMALYDTDGAFLSSAAQPLFRQAYCTTPVWSSLCGGYFFTVTTYEGDTQLLFWDLSVPMQGEDLAVLTREDLLPEEGTAVSQALYERAEALSAAYGVNIRIAEQCDTEYFTYITEQNLNEDEIAAALEILNETLSDYPDGFMEQLKYGTYRELEINLTGALTPRDLPEDANGFTSFIAFVEQSEDKTIMVLDIGEGLAMKQHFYHEMSHVIDRKLEFDAQYREGARYSEEAWSAMNPDGFDYTWDYHRLPDGIYWDGFDNWFIDTYSRTFPSEDRARILEYAMIGHHYPFEEEGPLREKLEFYAACIRDCFDTAGWPEVTLWEEAL